MTIERPMFPPREESKFPFNVADRGGMASVYRRHRVEREARAREIGTVELTETAKNSRLRDARKTAWREAETRAEYFHRRMEFERVVGRMQEMGLPEGIRIPHRGTDGRRYVYGARRWSTSFSFRRRATIAWRGRKHASRAASLKEPA